MPRPSCTRLWGPVQEARAREIGALAAATSVLIEPKEVNEDLEAALRELIPLHVLPLPGDTAEALRVRLSASSFLHDAWVLRDGNGRRGYIRLNTTSYGQPRRVRWSKEVVGQHMDDNGDQVVGCVAYPHYYTRSPLDQTCEVMPPAVEALVSWAHMLAMPYLTKRSQASMPNACELNLYYTAFDSHIGRHRDNFTSQDLVEYLHNGDPSIVESTTNTQEANTSVLIWTVGNAPMELVLSFPRHASMAGDRATYIVKPEFTVRCSHGTLLIFTPLDDLFFCHEARFPKDVLEDMGAEGYRAAYVIRWLSEERATKVFHADGDRRGKLRVDAAMAQAEAARVRKLKHQRAQKRKGW
jgi:hypothetical protein